jgi:hypothetical protein
MTPAWSFDHSVTVRAAREAAWRFWSDVANWAVVDPAVEWACLDGPFEAGTRGRTKPIGAPTTQWTLVAVEPATRAVIELTAEGAVLRFTWLLRDDQCGTSLTQRVELEGEAAARYLGAMQGLAENIPLGMAKLVSAIEAATTGPPNNSTASASRGTIFLKR